MNSWGGSGKREREEGEEEERELRGGVHCSGCCSAAGGGCAAPARSGLGSRCGVDSSNQIVRPSDGFVGGGKDSVASTEVADRPLVESIPSVALDDARRPGLAATVGEEPAADGGGFREVHP